MRAYGEWLSPELVPKECAAAAKVFGHVLRSSASPISSWICLWYSAWMLSSFTLYFPVETGVSSVSAEKKGFGLWAVAMQFA